MSTNTTLKNANKLVYKRNNALRLFSDAKSFLVLHLLNKRGAKDFKQIADELSLPLEEVKEVVTTLEQNDLVYRSAGDSFALTLFTEKRLNYSSVSLDFLVGSELSADSAGTGANTLRFAYTIKERIGKGATSCTFLAKQSGTHRDRVLKVFLPGKITYDQLDKALQKRAQIQGNVALPEIIDVGQANLQFPDGRSDIVSCVVLTFINGGAKTFSEFLKSQDNLNPTIFERFVERVGGALAAIEKVGLMHGDLHEGNILVVPSTSPSVAKEFWVIDYLGVPSANSPELESSSDIENFRDHLLRAAIIACERYPGCSVRLLLGERVFRVLEGLRKSSYQTFSDVLKDFQREHIPIPHEYFRTPLQDPFEWLRVEQIHSPDWLIRLFEPIPSRHETISRFGNTWISGPRGCGKSHYVRVLAFYQELFANSAQEIKDKMKRLNYDFRKAFGVLFQCRLGEFKPFVPEALEQQQFDPATQRFLKHILVLKIWNKTLHTIKEGLESVDQSTGKPVLEIPNDFKNFVQFLSKKLGVMAVLDDSIPISIFQQCFAMCVARENSATAVWHDLSHRPTNYLLNENDLDEFFGVLKQMFPDLGQTRFYVLVDDASFGHICYEMQKVLNSLVRATHANHCFKITFDKYMYTLDTSDGRSIDPRHEVTFVDLGEISVKAQRDTSIDLSEYMAKVVDRRLKEFGYKSSIQIILGLSQNAREFLSALSLPSARRPKKGEKPIHHPPRPRAYYAGWNIVYSISHGSVRTLLELVEYIFKTNNVTQNTSSISLKDQDSAVRDYANRQFKALSMLPGEFEGEPLGRRLQAIISAIGEMSRQYLERYETGEENRWYETISLERLDRNKLTQEAHKILEELIKYGLILDEGVTFSRAQFGLCQRYDMNKIFAPAFETTYRVRNHIYLSKERFEEFLLKPDAFVRRHRQKLNELAQRKIIQKTLF